MLELYSGPPAARMLTVIPSSCHPAILTSIVKTMPMRPECYDPASFQKREVPAATPILYHFTTALASENHTEIVLASQGPFMSTFFQCSSQETTEHSLGKHSLGQAQ